MKKNIDLVFLWHMHQPDYRDYATGDFVLPWTYLHAIKDYSDMAYHLERHPKIRAVVNFVPVLLDQLEDYTEQFASGHLRDPLLRLLIDKDPASFTSEQKHYILEACFRCNHEKMIEPYPCFKRLFDISKQLQNGGEVAIAYLSGQYMADLLTWYHLAWCGESMRREHASLVQLMSKAEGYTLEDRQQLFDLMAGTITDIIPRYRKLSERGQVEISSTPHYHPLAPLLIDFSSTREAMPDAPLPQAPLYPGGKGRVAAHINKAKKSHARRFGKAPTGMWPAEGSISNATLSAMAKEGCRWVASGENVLSNSLRHAQVDVSNRQQNIYRPYRVEGWAKDLHCFFRDDRLSDLIGFEYSRWHGQDASRHFIDQLDAIGAHASHDEVPVVSVILDGENAWEYFPYNGYYFLDGLYTALEAHPTIQTYTYESYLKHRETAKHCAVERNLPSVIAGSWVYGNFSTWIGCRDKNRAWDLLCAAKQSYDMVVAAGRLNEDELTAAELQLCSCESSDWFWWFGDYNPSLSVASFDRLFRHNLMELYRLLKLPVPAALEIPISQGSLLETEVSGTMRRGSEHS